MTSPTKDLIATICALHLVRASDIRGPSRAHSIFQARRALVVALDAMGKSSVEIGRIVNRDHTSVLAMLGRTARTQVSARSTTPTTLCAGCQRPCSRTAKMCRACNMGSVEMGRQVTFECLWCHEPSTAIVRSGRRPMTCSPRCRQLRKNWLHKCWLNERNAKEASAS